MTIKAWIAKQIGARLIEEIRDRRDDETFTTVTETLTADEEGRLRLSEVKMITVMPYAQAAGRVAKLNRVIDDANE